MRYRGCEVKDSRSRFSDSCFEKKNRREKKEDNKWKLSKSSTCFTLLVIVILSFLLATFLLTQPLEYEQTKFAEDVKYRLIDKNKLDSTKFINTKLNARNVLEIPIHSATINELIDYYMTYIEPNLRDEKYVGPIQGLEGHEFFCVSPSWKSDIQWISVNNLASYNHFFQYFEAMGLNDIFKQIIDIDSKIVVYSIFFVVRSKISNHNWHIDFENGTNVNAFTLLTPLQNKSQVHLAYKNIDGNTNKYEYKKNIGIVFGENFLHSTDVAFNDNKEVVFCFSFGTDKLSDWEYIKETAATQGEHYMHPIHGFVPT